MMSRNSIQQVHIGKRSNVVNAGILIDKLDRMFTSGTSALTGNEEEIEAELMETPEGHRRDVAAALQRQGEPLGGAGDVGGRQRRLGSAQLLQPVLPAMVIISKVI